MALAIIPSRFQSSRFPGKALASVDDEPLVARVAKRVLETGLLDQVVVATDDPRIVTAVEHLPVGIHLDTERQYRCGSDRVAAAAHNWSGDVVVNVQGDEALVDRASLEAAMSAMGDNDLGTVAAALPHPGLLDDPDAVKVVVDLKGRAVDFSRSPLPGKNLLHLGVYCFSRTSLERFAALPPSPREIAERLEQLRAKEAGMTIGVGLVKSHHVAVNRPGDIEDLELFCARIPRKRRSAPVGRFVGGKN